jgi:hypothetical protein
MNKTEYIAFAEAEMNRVLAIVRKKNSDYTGGTECTDPFANFTISTDFGVPPLTGLCIRMADKFQRVKTFCRDGKMAQSNEGAVDAFRDIIGYSLIALGMLEEQRQWQEPSEVDDWDITVEDAMSDYKDSKQNQKDVVGKVVDGGVYKDRLGRQVQVAAQPDTFVYPFQGNNGMPYYDDGTFAEYNAAIFGGSPSFCDLVEVVSEPQADLAPQDEPQVAHARPNLSLKVGGVYRNRLGEERTIVKDYGDEWLYPFVDNHNRAYTETGARHYMSPDLDAFDLITVVSEPQEDA